MTTALYFPASAPCAITQPGPPAASASGGGLTFINAFAADGHATEVGAGRAAMTMNDSTVLSSQRTRAFMDDVG
jgi:hypothetical protein